MSQQPPENGPQGPEGQPENPGGTPPPPPPGQGPGQAPPPPPPGQGPGQAPPPPPPGQGPGQAPPPPPPGQGPGQAPPPPPPGPGQPANYGAAPEPPSAYPNPQQGGFQSPPPPGPDAYGQYGQPGPGYGGPPQYNANPYEQAYPQQFTVGAAVSYGWNAVTKNLGPWILVMLIIGIASVLVSFLLNPNFDYNFTAGDLSSAGSGGFGMPAFTAGGALLTIVSSAVSMLLWTFLYQGAVHQLNGRKPSLGDFFQLTNPAQAAIAALILGGVAGVGQAIPVIGGLVFLAVWLLGMFTLPIVLSGNVPAMEAIKGSVNLVTQNFGSVLLLALACFGIMVLGFIACLVGALVAIPVGVVAASYGAKSLSNQPIAPVV